MSKKAALTWRESCGISSIPVVQIRKQSMVMYYEPLGHFHRSKLNKWKSDKELEEKRKGTYSGKVTTGVKKRLTKAIEIMLQVIIPKWVDNTVTGKLQYHRLSFITLKIPGIDVNAREAYDKCFSHFLDWLSRTANVVLYIWKLEPQKDLQVHYHITTEKFIDYREIRKVWNGLLRKGGYLNEYAKEYGHFDPNSTDIHEVTHVENMSKYLKKALTDSIEAAERIKKNRNQKLAENIGGEMAKDVQDDFIADGKIWGCSENLSASKLTTICLEERHLDKIKELIAAGKCREIADESGFWRVWYFTDTGPPEILSRSESLYNIQMLRWHMRNPGKNAGGKDFSEWWNSKPILN